MKPVTHLEVIASEVTHGVVEVRMFHDREFLGSTDLSRDEARRLYKSISTAVARATTMELKKNLII